MVLLRRNDHPRALSPAALTSRLGTTLRRPSSRSAALGAGWAKGQGNMRSLFTPTVRGQDGRADRTRVLLGARASPCGEPNSSPGPASPGSGETAGGGGSIPASSSASRHSSASRPCAPSPSGAGGNKPRTAARASSSGLPEVVPVRSDLPERAGRASDLLTLDRARLARRAGRGPPARRAAAARSRASSRAGAADRGPAAVP